jgi:hypothetical protein
VNVLFYSFFNLGARWGRRTPRPGRFTPGEKHGTHRTGGWVGPMASLDGGGEHLLPPTGFEPRSVQPAANRYTDSGIPAALLRSEGRIFIHKCSGFLVFKGFHLHLNKTNEEPEM